MYELLAGFTTVNGTLQDKECITGALRLVGGSNELEGRLEICINRAWGTVCSDSFSESDAKVVCRQLGAPFNGELDYLCDARLWLK